MVICWQNLSKRWQTVRVYSPFHCSNPFKMTLFKISEGFLRDFWRIFWEFWEILWVFWRFWRFWSFFEFLNVNMIIFRTFRTFKCFRTCQKVSKNLKKILQISFLEFGVSYIGHLFIKPLLLYDWARWMGSRAT